MRSASVLLRLLVLACALLLVLAASAPAAEPGNSHSTFAAISADGRFVAFESAASNLVPRDRNFADDIFVRDLVSGGIQRVSVGPAGAEGNGQSITPDTAISADGRFVAFTSFAWNLVAGDTNRVPDVFVRDRSNGTTERVSLGGGGAEARDESARPSINANGRFVAFVSAASNLVDDDRNGTWDVFVRDRARGTTERVSVGSDGAEANNASRLYTKATISADGRFVAFTSVASNLVPDDRNGVADVFVRDRLARTTERVSVGDTGAEAAGESGLYIPSISADGRFVVFASNASNLVAADTNGVYDVFLRDRVANRTERVSVANDGSQGDSISWDAHAISPDGRFVAFTSYARNLVVGDTNDRSDVFVRDRGAGTTERISVGAQGQAYEGSGAPAISADGAFVLFISHASNLVPGDVNGSADVFVRDRSTGRTELVSVGREAAPEIISTALSPRTPRAGKTLTVTMQVLAGGRFVGQAKVAGRAKIGARMLPLKTKGLVNSAARFVWRLPKNASGKRLSGSISVTTAGGTATKRFAAVVR